MLGYERSGGFVDKVTTFLATVAAVLMSVGTMLVAAVIAGTIMWILWPSVIPVILPKVVQLGWLPARIPWWTGVAFTWIMPILFGKFKTEVKGKV